MTGKAKTLQLESGGAAKAAMIESVGRGLDR